MITGEYFVLGGAKALAVPVKLGQHLEIRPNQSATMYWESWNFNNQSWLKATFSLPDLLIVNTDNQEKAEVLQHILKQARNLNPDFLSNSIGFNVKTRLEFDLNWGLGSSSTLVNNIASWAAVDPFKLQENTFGGSGYDIACAVADGPIIYQKKEATAVSEQVAFDPPFTEHLYFAYLGKKQDTRKGIELFKQKPPDKNLIIRISEITEQLIKVRKLADFDTLIEEHEGIVAEWLNLTPAKTLYFKNFWGTVKSLGAWGGDFVLITSEKDKKETEQYFKQKGFETIFAYKDMVFNG